MNKIKRFNARVYGILINEKDELLLSHEEIEGFKFTKLPGGGIKFGESPPEALKREYREEVDINVEVGNLVFAGDVFIQNRFIPEEQVITLYYYVKYDDWKNIKLKAAAHHSLGKENKIKHEWKPLKEINEDTFTFVSDKRLAEKVIKEIG